MREFKPVFPYLPGLHVDQCWGSPSKLLNYQWLWQYSEMQKTVNSYAEEDVPMSSVFLAGSQINMKLM